MSKLAPYFLLITGLAVSICPSADAVPINGNYADLPHCDSHPSQQFQHELGDTSTFPINEAFIVSVVPMPVPFAPVCVADDLLTNDYNVRITNISGLSYTDLFFVADDPFSVGNFDGLINDVNAPGSAAAHAFRIDGTVTLGLNNPLLSESINNNEIFEPGEVWDFSVINFTAVDINGTPLPPMFDSPGGFAGTSTGFPPSTASIVANLVPEPSGGALAIGLWTWLMCAAGPRTRIRRS